jgi:NAD-dependent protein deacetylase/lipoamidase
MWNVTVLTGAGISAESGLPTFRGAQSGLWAQYDPMQLATPEAFQADPGLVWRWYQWRRGLVAEAEPNAGHRATAELEQRVTAAGGRFSLVTQNVDGLHRKAGSTDPIEFHGNLWHNHCFDCGESGGPVAQDLDAPPPCPDCGGLMRPSVVWFGEQIPEAAIERSFAAVQQCTTCIVVGTSSLVYPAAALPQVALEVGAEVIEVNPEETPLSRLASRSLRGTAVAVLPGLVEALVS